jgi:hypothetical protein
VPGKRETLEAYGDGKREKWLLVKMDDEGADARRNPVKRQPKSVLSGRTIEDLVTKSRSRTRRAG